MFSLFESALVLVDSSTSLVDSRVEEVSSVDSRLFFKGKTSRFKPLFFIVPALRIHDISRITCQRE